ncbi:hypothetical protein [Planctomicrobium sp. SH527]|uniref:hypothetical protein n=1 Tax=Planctomicrobium sp. SH527 TaxID=3448123 RepID=UPI003F5B589C
MSCLKMETGRNATIIKNKDREGQAARNCDSLFTIFNFETNFLPGIALHTIPKSEIRTV